MISKNRQSRNAAELTEDIRVQAPIDDDGCDVIGANWGRSMQRRKAKDDMNNSRRGRVGGGTRDLWGTVTDTLGKRAAIQAAAVLEICGPLFMSVSGGSQLSTDDGKWMAGVIKSPYGGGKDESRHRLWALKGWGY